jgi:hypothetical protein
MRRGVACERKTRNPLERAVSPYLASDGLGAGSPSVGTIIWSPVAVCCLSICHGYISQETAEGCYGMRTVSQAQTWCKILTRNFLAAWLINEQCDTERPCTLCVRAGAQCIPRESLAAENYRATGNPANVKRKEAPQGGQQPGSPMLPESNIVDLSNLVS